MQAFLKQVAQQYIDDPKFSQRSFVFVSKRAQAFFMHYLQELCLERGATIFAPHCMAINDFLLKLKPEYQVLDKTELLFRLYDCRQRQHSYEGLGEEQESLDNFLFWGNIILSDFDTIDRQLADAHQIYRNIEGLKELDDTYLDFLSEETKAAIEQYFKGFVNSSKMNGQERESYREHYLRFWSSLYELYELFTQEQERDKLAYEGYIYRQIAETDTWLDDLGSQHKVLLEQGIKPIVFVGLFELSKSEEQIMSKLRRHSLAEFIWDEDVLVIQDKTHPAARLMAHNKDLLGYVQLPQVSNTSLQEYLPKDFRLYRCASTVTQVKALGEIFEHSGIDPNKSGLETLIVLSDEQMLLPLVGAIPSNYSNLNISLGYPLNRTSVSTLIHRWLRLFPTAYQGAFSVPSILNLFSLQILGTYFPGLYLIATRLSKQKHFMLSGAWIADIYLPNLCERLRKNAQEEQAQSVEDAKAIVDLLLKPVDDALSFLYQIDSLLTLLAERMMLGIEQTEQALGFELSFLMNYQKLVRRLLSLLSNRNYHNLSCQGAIQLLETLSRNISIPFKGDPLNGLQIMGLLESRSLHFEQVIYLNAQEGRLPKLKHTATFIPNILRYAYGLPTREYDDLAASYRFYQSIARSKTLIMLSGQEDSLGGKGEESRFIAQLTMLYKLKPKVITVETTPKARGSQAIVIDKKQDAVMQKLEKWLTLGQEERKEEFSQLSASSLLTYLQCPLRFYYQYICDIKESPTPSEIIAPNDYGTILHDTLANYIYNIKPGTIIQKQTLEHILEEGMPYLRKKVSLCYQNYYAQNSQKRDLTKLDSCHIELIATSILSLIKYDYHHCPFIYLSSEALVEASLPIIYKGEKREVRFKGYIDRLDVAQDETGAYLRILDYKTGKDSNKPFSNIEKLFAKVKENKAIIQILLYGELLLRSRFLEKKQFKACVTDEISARIKPGLLITNLLINQEKDYVPFLTLSRDEQSSGVEYSSLREEYLEVLEQKLSELFDLDTPFVQVENEDDCLFCPFISICRRKPKLWSS